MLNTHSLAAGRLQLIRAIGLLSIAVGLASCAQHPINPQLAHYEPNQLFPNIPSGPPGNSDELLMVLTFSGGGARAAALSYGILEELAATQISLGGHERRLLDEVDLISAVSGGSFTAAYYGLFGDRIFTDFEQRYLKKNVAGALSARMLLPTNWWRLASPYFHRSDLAAEYYDKHIFDGGTFADIQARGIPIIINATNMTEGTVFGFDLEQFGWICSDLMRFPVSRAVAASSAVPVVMSPVTLQNYAGECGYQQPRRIAEILQTHELSSRVYHQAASMAAYLNRETQPYIHLYDGGISDNLGLRAAIDAVTLAGGAAQAVLHNQRLVHTQNVIFIVVNAQTAPDNRWAQSARGPSLGQVLSSVTRVPLDRYNFETIALLRSSFREWEKQIAQVRCGGEREAPTSACADIRFNMVEISFAALDDEREQAYLKQLSSSVTIPTDDIDRLRKAARQILVESEEFQTFLQDIGSTRIMTPP